jgi:carboxypeptidase C (cathepsin A)
MSVLRLAVLLCAAALVLVPAGVRAQADPTPSPSASPRPIPHVPDALTHGAIVIGGKRLAYSARAGSLLLRDGHNSPTASMFYVAYIAEGAGGTKRPVTFFWNGGPGSSTIWLHMGSFAPVRVVIPADGTQPGPVPRLTANESSLLDTSDLVFVDAVGTGWSTLVARGQAKDFYGVDEDAKAFAQFIERWVTRNGRWESPKFLFGESYGTLRAPNVARILGGDGMALSGIILLSSVLDYNLLPIGQGPGEDYPYIAYLPTEAAVAWYHHKVPGNPPDLVRFVSEVSVFAGGAYAHALLLGDALDPATRSAIVAKLHAYTGLSESYIRAADLRIVPGKFRQELLRGQSDTLGRYDARYSGRALDANAAFPDYDPSNTMTSAAFVAAFNHYAHDVLHYRDERPYDVLAFDVNRAWKYQRDDDPSAPSVVADLKSALTLNPSLRVLAASGYFDLATGFYGTEYLLHHMGLDAAQSRRVEVANFRSGHMVYLNHDALVAFKAELVRFYREAQAPAR